MNKKPMDWTLGDVLQACAEATWRFDDADLVNRQPMGFSIDTRSLAPDEVFVALEGEHADGHDYIGAAFERGALAAVVSRRWFTAHGENYLGGNFIIVEDTLRALQEMARAYRRRLDPEVFALTGTNGKTTTKEMVGAILSTQMVAHKTPGNWNNHIGVPLTLLSMRQPVDVVVLEMGTNHFGEIALLCQLAEPDTGLITNVGHGHTEFLQDVDGVRREKGALFAWLAARGVAFVNANDPQVVRAADETGVRRKVTFGFDVAADVRASGLQLDDEGCATFVWNGHCIRVGTPGLHSAANALAAVAVGQYYQIRPENMAAVLAQPLSVGGRMRRLQVAGRVVIDDSYNANPESMRAALQFLSRLRTDGKRVAILGDMFELGALRDQAHHDVLQFAADQKIDEILVIGEAMQAAVEQAGSRWPHVRFFTDRAALIEALLLETRPGDVLLIKGSRGMKMEEILQAFEQRTLDDSRTRVL